MFCFETKSKKKEEMKVMLEIPEITIPGYNIEVDISNDDVVEKWKKVANMFEEMCLFIEEPIGEVSSEVISDPINNVIESVYAQLIDAEEKYAEFIKKG